MMEYKFNFFDFVVRSFKTLHPNEQFINNWHIRYICNEIEESVNDLLEGKERKHHLLFNTPPRSMRSIIFSVCLPAYLHLLNKDLKLLVATYSQSIATHHRDLTIEIIGSEWYQKLNPIKSVKYAHGYYVEKSQGHIKYAGNGSALAGFGANIIIVDSLQSMLDGESNVRNGNSIDYFNQTVMCKLVDIHKGLIIVNQERLREDDLSSLLIKKDKFKQICIPAELNDNVTPSHLKTFYQDELMWHERLSKKDLNEFKELLGDKLYNAVFNQKAI